MKTGYVTLTYKHNGAKPAGGAWSYGTPYAWKIFDKVPDAKQWIKDNPQYMPCKLLVMNTRNGINQTLIDYREVK